MRLAVTEIKDARAKLSELREKRRHLINEVRNLEASLQHLRKERDEKNKKVRELFAKAREQREKRDKINEEVALNKQMRDILRKQADELYDKLQKLEEEMHSKGGGRIPKGVTRRIRELEEKIETTPNLTKEEEKRLIEQIEKLSEDLEKLEFLKEKQTEVRQIRNKLKDLRIETRAHDAAVKTLAQQSQEHHEEFIKAVVEAKQLRQEADSIHHKILELNEKIKALRQEIGAVSKEADLFSKKLGEETLADKRKRETEARKKRETHEQEIAKKLLEKYQAGEKLSLEELRILYDKGLVK